MYRTLSISGILLTAAFLFTDCDGGCPEEIEAVETKTITFTVGSYQEYDDEECPTRTSVQNGKEFVWAAGDTVGIYPNTGAQVYFAMEGGAGAKSAVFDGGGWALKQSSTYYSYYPFIGDIYLDRHRIPVSYTGQRQVGATGIEHIGPYDYMFAKGTATESGALNFEYKHLGCIIRPNLTNLPAGKYIKLAVTAPSNVFAKSGWFDLQSESPTIVGTEYTNQIVIDLDEVSVDGSTNVLVYVMSSPVRLKGTKITISVLNDRKKEFQCTKTPSADYNAGTIGGLTCKEWTEVPQSMGMIIDGWGDGGNIGGDAE